MHIPCVDALDSHLAKFAMPRATCASTSGCPHLTIPNKAAIPPSDLSFVCNLSMSEKDIVSQNLVNKKILCILNRRYHFHID